LQSVDEMTKSQRNFVNYYIESDFRNATAAYMRAYPQASEKSARRNASRLLTNADILEHLSETLSEIIRREKIPLEKRILDVWVRRAFYDPAEIIDNKGELLCPLEELSRKGLSICVESVEVINRQGREITKIELADRNVALEHLQKYIAMIKPQAQKIEIISNETRARLAVLYDEEMPGLVNPAHIEKQTEAPDDE